MDRPIVVVGSINLDLVCRVQRIPAPGETLWGDSFQQFHGGKGANQAVAAARLGANVSMVGRVGDDTFGEALRQGLLDANVNAADVAASPGSSGVALISVDRAGQNSIIVVPGANGTLTPAELEESMPRLRSAGLLLAQLEVPMETVEFLCEFANSSGIPLMLDPAPARDLSPQLLRSVTYLTPNESEAASLAGINATDLTRDSVAGVAQELQARGTRNVIVKMGGHGAYLLPEHGNGRFIPAFRVDAVDTTAAGDAFNGGCATALVRGCNLEDAVAYGMAVAAVSVTRPGAQPAMPSAAEVEALMQQRGRPLPANMAAALHAV